MCQDESGRDPDREEAGAPLYLRGMEDHDLALRLDNAANDDAAGRLPTGRHRVTSHHITDDIDVLIATLYG